MFPRKRGLTKNIFSDKGIRQYQILEDAAIFTVFQTNHQQFVKIAALTSLSPSPKYSARVPQKKICIKILPIKIRVQKKTRILKFTIRKVCEWLRVKGNFIKGSLSALAKQVRNQVTEYALVSVYRFFRPLLIFKNHQKGKAGLFINGEMTI
ncbi:MAG: hypothetical protein H0A75_07385 [Candidatus Methanofishera endochildressiae]|uniref:Uncharacterized protein n=1 Tax=Candidatus Methanofishera endochildressiae TaxID=2738884 RepID=A0A7Z0SFH9_9GAMM|nr:hypothetical protein [Candidatus Methanofishera endochildressiae]